MQEAAELDPTTDSTQVCGWHRRGLRGLWVKPAPVTITYGEDIAVREIQRTWGLWGCLDTNYKCVGNQIAFKTRCFFCVVDRSWSLMDPTVYMVSEYAYRLFFFFFLTFLLQWLQQNWSARAEWGVTISCTAKWSSSLSSSCKQMGKSMSVGSVFIERTTQEKAGSLGHAEWDGIYLSFSTDKSVHRYFYKLKSEDPKQVTTSANENFVEQLFIMHL